MPGKSQLKRIIQAEFDCNWRTFWRAAEQRLRTANVLLKSRVYLDAVYLGGYAVECALKALILARTMAAKRAETCKELTSGAKSNNFDVLTESLRAKGCPPPANIRGLLDSLSDEWRTDLRYIGALIPHREAEQFLERVQSVYEWVARTL